MLSEGQEYASRLLRLAKHPNYKEVAEKLVENYPVHDFFVDFREASEELGLPVRHLDAADFEILQPILQMVEQGFYGFVKQGKLDATTKKPTAQKRLAVIPKTVTGATA